MKSAATNKKSPKDSCVETSYIVLPSHTNALGSIFGGTIMSWIDVVGAICAQRHSGRICVTASVDALHFIHPVESGNTVTLYAKAVYTGRTSMMIEVEVYAENPMRGSRAHCVSALLTFVALGEDRKPTPVPELLLTTDEERAAFERARSRREAMLQQSRS
jgi:uncharacterized protein (TIGR00369 family)